VHQIVFSYFNNAILNFLLKDILDSYLKTFSTSYLKIFSISYLKDILNFFILFSSQTMIVFEVYIYFFNN